MQEQIAFAGVSYGRMHAVLYRAGLAAQVLGACVLSLLYPLGSPFYSAGIMLFEAGVLLSALFLLVWMHWVKKVILGSVLFGLAAQVAGFYAPPQFAGEVIIAGIGLVCVGAAGLAGKEAYCFGWREGWVLGWLYAGLVIANLAGLSGTVANSIGFSAVFLLLLSLLGRKLRQPLLTPCGYRDEGNAGPERD